ncbi:hypothetical protein P170DRAFT_246951 [Aspergillus steynii IBT 23096]|uniref:Uncharacterized protein n=1 Tax=Aspergillus steynii IBT 23096 TaxID=1392250 RepID=A0A2I2FY70_9EURO|nr:uncharacterized protein P170DRAFT_246951 [Aspergillus steynii IBT 23096]PLB45585.1 hypothetical protein P170DRAFT_246951 [Aspergillus steynii IBT 23096]
MAAHWRRLNPLVVLSDVVRFPLSVVELSSCSRQGCVLNFFFFFFKFDFSILIFYFYYFLNYRFFFVNHPGHQNDGKENKNKNKKAWIRTLYIKHRLTSFWVSFFLSSNLQIQRL